MSNHKTNLIAACLLIFLFLIAVFSMKGDSATMDEVAHLPSGYSYLTQKDMRLNPEHPPLIKDLSAIPLLFIKNINFPSGINDWKEDVNGQWGFGYKFLYQSGNPADKMIFWARISMVLILILLGYYLFRWTRELFGNRAGLLALFLFSFSPTLIAHGRLVTTDLGAAAGVFIASYYFIRFLKDSCPKNLIIAGLAFGLAELAKFSLILLIPFFGVITLVWIIIKSSFRRHFLKVFFRYIFLLILVFLVGYILIWAVYQYHTWGYPPERQVRDTNFILASFPSRFLADSVVWMADKPFLRPAAQYLLGVFMILQRAAGGHTTYFMGEVSASGWKSYFPMVYALKEPLAFYVLLIISLLYASWLIKKPVWQKPWLRARLWLASHFPEFAMLVFMAIYWLTSLSSNLNIGVRHLLPVFPFTILLVSGIIVQWLKSPLLKLKKLLLFLLLIWQAASVIFVYPHFLAYFNELAGGPDEAYIYTVDSNLDWGQDLRRLTKWVEQQGIDKIYVDYFGGGEAGYYLKEKFVPWWGTGDPKEIPRGSYLAVSVTFLQSGRGEPVAGFDQPYGYYRWLDQYAPVAKIGHSIFVYYIN